MFKYIKEMRRLKKENLEYMNDTLLYASTLLGKIVVVTNSIPDIVELAKTVSSMDAKESEKFILDAIVKYTEEHKKESDDTEVDVSNDDNINDSTYTNDSTDSSEVNNTEEVGE